MPATLKQKARLVAVVLAALAAARGARAQLAYTADTIPSLAYREFQRDGRFYVFNDMRRADAFEKTGEVGTAITRPGLGPSGETVVADNETALELFLFKHGLHAEVERPQAPPLNIVWRDGKTRLTLGNSFYLELSNRVQFRFTQELPDETVKLPGTASPGDGKGSFRIRRAKLKFEGWFYHPWLTYEVQTNWPGISSVNLGQYLEDANLNWDVTRGRKRFMLKLGQFKVPFGLQELTSSGSQQLVDRSLVSISFARGRDIGVSLWGVLGKDKLEYRAGLFNGAGVTRSSNDNGKYQYNARVTFQPNGAVPLGSYSGAAQSESDFETAALGKAIFTLSGAYEHNDLSFVTSDPSLNLITTLYEVDFMFKSHGFSATGMYAWGTRKPQAQSATYDTSGYFVQAGYFLKPQKWELAARYGQNDPSNLVRLDQVTEIRGGINYFVNRHALKVQADFGQIKTESASGGTRNYELRVQTQFVF
jgi:phosphate-selective porin